ncbi:MAG: VCBS repeat-containing protein [Bryobacteraceae bacterium]
MSAILLAVAAGVTIAGGATLPPAVVPAGNLLVTGDFNGDGWLDIVSVVRSQGSGAWYLAVFANDGSGHFNRGTTMSLNAEFVPFAITAADFDRDGRLDVAILGNGPNGSQVLVALHRTASFFTYAIPIASNGFSLSAGDFTGDAFPDLLVTTYGNAQEFINPGNGIFDQARPVATLTIGVPLIADLNSDGNLDFALWSTGSQYPSSSVYLGDGQGNFTQSTAGPFPGNIGGMSIADLNSDGKPDLVSVLALGTMRPLAFQVAYGNGDGTFQKLVSPAASLPYPNGFGIATGDVNNDGRIDVLVLAGDAQSSIVAVYFNIGNGAFSEPVSTVLPRKFRGIQLATFTADNYLDLLIEAEGFQLIDLIQFNDGSGRMGAAE